MQTRRGEDDDLGAVRQVEEVLVVKGEASDGSEHAVRLGRLGVVLLVAFVRANQTHGK